MDGGEKITSGLVIAGCDGSELLKLAEKVLDQVSCLVQVLVIKLLAPHTTPNATIRNRVQKQ